MFLMQNDWILGWLFVRRETISVDGLTTDIDPRYSRTIWVRECTEVAFQNGGRSYSAWTAVKE